MKTLMALIIFHVRNRSLIKIHHEMIIHHLFCPDLKWSINNSFKIPSNDRGGFTCYQQRNQQPEKTLKAKPHTIQIYKIFYAFKKWEFLLMLKTLKCLA